MSGLDVNTIKKRIYNNIDPFEYPLNFELNDLYNKTVILNKKVKRAGNLTGFKYYDESLKLRDPIFYKYLGLSGVKRKDSTYNLKKSKYKPTLGADNVTYYKHPGLNDGLKNYAKYANGPQNPVLLFIDEGLGLLEGHNTTSSAFTDAFGVHTIGKGYDNKGAYISYYDKWNLSPLKLYESIGMLHPINFYDRFYLDDIMGLNKDAIKGTHWLPEIIVERKARSKREGGNIMQYFKNGKNTNNLKSKINNQKIDNQRHRLNVLVPNPAPVDNTRVSPTKFTNYERYKALLAIEGLWRGLLYIESTKWPKPLYKEILPFFKNGKKIHIKESLKGSFTKYCGGNVTSECIARGKASPDPRIRKKATFADNARKWKHLFGGMLHKPEIEDESTEYGPEYWANIKIDPDSLNPYGAYKFGLPAYNDKWYVGDKAGNSLLTFVNNLYNELQSNIKTAYPEYSNGLVNNLADFMVRHYIKENGWRKVNKLVGGYGKATSTQQWINGMKKNVP